MYLVQIFRASPLTAVALCVCLATILWCIRLTRRQASRLDRALTGLLGMIAIYQALHLLTNSGVAFFGGFRKLDGWVEFLIAALCMTAALILKFSSMDRAITKVRLRLVEANEKTPDLGKLAAAASQETVYALFNASPLAIFAVDSHNTVIYWNPAAEDLLGWKRDEMMGRALPFDGKADLLNKRGRPVEAAIWTAAVRSSNGSTCGRLIIAASRSALRSAGVTELQLASLAGLVLNH
jgi:PAS domain-containing protein